MNFLETRLGDKIKKITTKINIFGDRSETFVSTIVTDDEGTYIYLGNKDRLSEGYRFHKLKIFILPDGTLKYQPDMYNKFGKVYNFSMKIVESIVFTLDYWDSEDNINLENLQTVQIKYGITAKECLLKDREIVSDYCRVEPHTRVMWAHGVVKVIEFQKTILSLKMTYENYVKNLEKLKDQRIRNFL